MKRKGSQAEICLQREHRLVINKKKVYRLLAEMKMLQPQRRKRLKHPRKLANNREIKTSNELWEMDIKYGYIAGEQRLFEEACVTDDVTHERISPKTPNKNAYIEPFHSLLEAECLQRYEFSNSYEVVKGCLRRIQSDALFLCSWAVGGLHFFEEEQVVVKDCHWPKIWAQWVCLYRLS